MQALTGQRNRALVVVNGKRMLDHVTDALHASETIGAVSVVGDVPESERYTRLPDTDDFVQNLFAGMERYAKSPFVLIATADLPFLTGESVTAFVQDAIARAEETGAGGVYPIVPVADCYARFPNVRRTSLRLREGEFTGGNLMLARPNFLLPLRQRIADAYAARKSPLRLAFMLGLDMVFLLLISQKLAPKMLRLESLERRVSRLLGAEGRALLCSYPEIATDLDRPSDFEALGVGR